MSARDAVLGSIRAALGAHRSAPPEAAPMGPAAPVYPAAFAARLAELGVPCLRAGNAVAAKALLGPLLDDLCGGAAVAASDAPLVRAALGGRPALAPDAPRAELLAAGVGVTSAALGIVETGTVVLHDALERSRVVSLLPPVHVVLVPTDALVATLDDALARLRELPPGNVTLVTGPSRTADIELRLVVGVHGPGAVHVILIDSPTRPPENPAR